MLHTPSSGSRVRYARVAPSAALLLALLCPGNPFVLAGELPPNTCSTANSHDDTSSPWCTLISSLEVFGGDVCKPEVIATAVAVRFGVIPEGCCGTGVSFDQAFAVRLAYTGPAATAMTATSVPCVAYVRCELEYSNVQVSIRLPGWSQDRYANSSTPSYRDTLRGEVTVTESGALGTAAARDIAGQIYLLGTVHAEACNGSTTYSESQAIADPFLEVDPSSPLAAQWKVEKETSPGSGVWVEMKRDSAAVQFTDVTAGALSEPSYTGGIAWGDVDGDGDLDLFVANSSNSSCRLFRNDGGVLTDATTPDLALPSTYNMQPTWADIDNDGDLDLYMTRSIPPYKHVLFRNDGAGGLVRDSSSVLCYAGFGRGAAWADYDLDGDLDVFVGHCSGGNKLFRNDGTGHFTDVTTPLLADNGCGMGGIWGDYDNDGDPDLYLMTHNGSTRCKLLRNTNGVFTDVTAASAIPVSEMAATFSGTWVDYDDDGWIDLFALTDTGNRLFRNLRNGTFADSTSGWIAYGGLGSAAAWGDLDLDGDLDCYMTNRTNPNRVVVRYPGRFGNSMFHVGAPVDAPGVGNSAGWADIDGDGDLDLYAGYSNFKRLLRNDQNLGHHWLAVDLKGIQDNRFGVGSRIRVVAGGRSQYRRVLNDGYWSGNPLRQTFGFDSIEVVDTLEVRWPNGVVTTLVGPLGTDRRVAVSQDGTVTGVEPGAPYSGTSQLIGPAPNPFTQSTSIRFRLQRPMPVVLVLYDIAGRRLRTLASHGDMPAGESSLAWDGRTDAGDLAQPGVYFCKMRAGTFESGGNLLFRIVHVR